MTLSSKSKQGDVLHRAKASGYGCSVDVYYETWYVVALTDKGAWLSRMRDTILNRHFGHTWRVFNGNFAFTTQEEAFEQLKRRAASHVAHAERRYRSALRVAQHLELPGVDKEILLKLNNRHDRLDDYCCDAGGFYG